MSRTKFRTVLFYLSQVYIYFPKSKKIQTCPENSSIILSSLGELLFLAAILVLLCIFNQNISWDGINFSSFFLPLPQALHPNQKKRSCKKTVEREDRVIEANTAQIHLFSSGGKSNEFSIGGTKCLGNPERLDEVLEQGTKIFTPNICFYFLKQKKLQSSSTILSKQISFFLTVKDSTLLLFSVTHSCPTLSDSVDCSLSGSSVYRIFQMKILEWVPISISRELSDSGIKPVSLASPKLSGKSFIWEMYHLGNL